MNTEVHRFDVFASIFFSTFFLWFSRRFGEPRRTVVFFMATNPALFTHTAAAPPRVSDGAEGRTLCWLRPHHLLAMSANASAAEATAGAVGAGGGRSGAPHCTASQLWRHFVLPLAYVPPYKPASRYFHQGDDILVPPGPKHFFFSNMMPNID